MQNSGIENLWQTVYGSATIPHMLSGHSFARAVRSHILTISALVAMMQNECPELKSVFSSIEIEKLHGDALVNNVDSRELLNQMTAVES